MMPQRLGLAPFLEELRRRLDGMTPAQLRSALLQHARTLPPGERPGFLAVFRGPSPPARPAWLTETLLGDAEELARQIRDQEFYEYGGWDPELRDERAFGDESWAWEMDDLLERTGQAFLAGEHQAAARAYRLLLEALDEDEGFLPAEGDPEEALSADLFEAKARYLRSVYETTPPQGRPEAVYEAGGILSHHRVGLRDIQETLPTPLPGWEDFLPRWIALLRAAPRPQFGSSDAEALLREAVEIHGGLEALAGLARERGRLEPRHYLAWAQALRRAGRVTAAGDAASEGLRAVPVHRLGREEVARELQVVAEALGDAALLAEAAREAFRSTHEGAHLLTLFRAGQASAGRAAAEAPAAPEAQGSRAGLTPLVEAELTSLAVEIEAELGGDPDPGHRHEAADCFVLLLAGRPQVPLARLREAPPLGWSSGRSAGPVVVPYVLAAMAGQAPQPGTAQADLWSAMDLAVTRLPVADPPSRLLLDRLHGVSLPPDALEVTVEAVRRRVEAIVQGQHRDAYRRAATAAAAVAEVLAGLPPSAAGQPSTGPAAARAWLQSLRARFPRHYRFRQELSQAADHMALDEDAS